MAQLTSREDNHFRRPDLNAKVFFFFFFFLSRVFSKSAQKRKSELKSLSMVWQVMVKRKMKTTCGEKGRWPFSVHRSLALAASKEVGIPSCKHKQQNFQNKKGLGVVLLFFFFSFLFLRVSKQKFSPTNILISALWYREPITQPEHAGLQRHKNCHLTHLRG